MGLFEPELVMHAIEHDVSDEKGYWCWCAPQEDIDEFNWRMRLHVHGYDPDNEDDVKRWRTDTYGKHDREQVGIMAQIVRIPETFSRWMIREGMWDRLDYVGRHRMRDEWTPTYVFSVASILTRYSV